MLLRGTVVLFSKTDFFHECLVSLIEDGCYHVIVSLTNPGYVHLWDLMSSTKETRVHDCATSIIKVKLNQKAKAYEILLIL